MIILRYVEILGYLREEKLILIITIFRKKGVAENNEEIFEKDLNIVKCYRDRKILVSRISFLKFN